MPLADPLPLPPLESIAAVLRSDPDNPPAAGDRHLGVFSSSNDPLLPYLLDEVIWLSANIQLDSDVSILGILASQGWATQGMAAVTAAYTPPPNVSVILANAAGGAFTVTLPDATQTGYTPGQRYTIVKTDATINAVIVTGTGGQLINNAVSQALTLANAAISVVFDGVTTDNWWVWSGISALTATLTVPTGVKTSNYTAGAHDYVVCNIFSGGFTVTLPTAPADGTVVGAQVIGVSGSNTLTVATGGTDVFDKAGGNTSVQLALLNQSALFQYVAAAGIWYGVASRYPLADLDARYVMSPQNYGGIFGDGSDGAVSLDGVTTYSGFSSLAGSTYTLTRDVFATTLTIGAGVTLIPAGYRVFCTGTLTIGSTGVIASNGTAGTAGGTGGGGSGGSGSIGSGRGGGGGATGNGSAGTNSGNGGIGAGGAGGASGANTAGGGGTAGASGSFWFKTPAGVLAGMLLVANTQATFNGGAGGGGGAGDGTNKGGGGGAGGGVVAILAPAVVNNGSITANGGAGGTPTAGNTGGGGGGGGGLILAYTLSAWTGSGTTSVTGGALGSLHGTGSNGNAGSAGTVLNQVLS